MRPEIMGWKSAFYQHQIHKMLEKRRYIEVYMEYLYVSSHPKSNLFWKLKMPPSHIPKNVRTARPCLASRNIDCFLPKKYPEIKENKDFPETT